MNVASTRFKAGKGIMDASVHLRKERGAGEATVGESVLATPLWSMLYADDAGVVSQSPEQLRKIMGLIVAVCAAFGLTVYGEAKQEPRFSRQCFTAASRGARAHATTTRCAEPTTGS